MGSIRQLPKPLQLVVVVVLLGAALFVVYAAANIPSDKGRYDFVKDIAIPLISPLVSILIPTVLFYIIPLSQNRQKAAIDLFTRYFEKDMKDARLDAWSYYVTEPKKLTTLEERETRLDNYLRFVTNAENNSQNVTKEEHGKMQAIGQVLSYFVIVNAGLTAGNLDKNLVKSFIVHYYLWWREEVLAPLRLRPIVHSKNLRFKPLWFADLTELDNISDSA